MDDIRFHLIYLYTKIQIINVFFLPNENQKHEFFFEDRLGRILCVKLMVLKIKKNKNENEMNTMELMSIVVWYKQFKINRLIFKD